jgi:hypothetical protein
VAGWGTILLDVYRSDDRRGMYEALGELCSPMDNWNFASAGIYAFWRPTGEVLYVGLARDLAQRFSHHNGLVRYLPTACKVRQIDSYFEREEKLGFSAVVQSPLSQPLTYRFLASFGETWKNARPGEAEEAEGEFRELRELEGRLLKGHVITHGLLPCWNEIAGARNASRAVVADDQTLDVMTGRENSLLVARRPIRELAATSSLAWLETWLHTARFNGVVRLSVGDETPIDRMIFEEIEKIAESPLRERDMLRKTNYLNRHPLDSAPPIDLSEGW